MRISLVQRELVDLQGATYRVDSDLSQLGLSPILETIPIGFQDMGIVTWNGIEYYMSTYTPPDIEVADD
jgi:hypothetical protein